MSEATNPIPKADRGPSPFEKAVYAALTFTSDQVKKVDVSIGQRSKTVTFKFDLTPDQVAKLDAMASSQ